MSATPAVSEGIAGGGWTVPGYLVARAAASPDATALWHLSDDSKWTATTWGGFAAAVSSVAAGLQAMGLSRGDRVGIFAPTSRQWDIAHFAILASGGVAVGLDPFGNADSTQTVVRTCRLAGLIVDRPDRLANVGDALLSDLRFVVGIGPDCTPGMVAFDSLLTTACRDGADWNLARPDEVATIIFTSGTTGTPKGIEYTHHQMCLAAAAILSAFPDIGAGSRLACWLPLSNLFQRMINLCAVARGAQTYYVPDPREIMRYAPAIAPHLFIGVPRFFEKLHQGIADAIDKKPPLLRRAARWAITAGERHARLVRSGQRPGLLGALAFAVADRSVLSKIRGVLGKDLRFMISGSAPMPPWLLERLDGIGLPVLEAYGLSENIVPVALNRPGDLRFGTVGKPLPGNEVRIADDGELLVRGDGVFSGYMGAPRDEAPIDADGFLASGDFARIDEDGFITLVGRKSEVFKTSTGRKVAPSGIEGHLLRIRGIEHAVVFGANRAMPVAMLFCTPQVWSPAATPEFCDALRAEAAPAVADLPAYLRPAALIVSTQALSIDAGDLTGNLKLRRRNVQARFAPVLDELYRSLDAAPGSPFCLSSTDGLHVICSL